MIHYLDSSIDAHNNRLQRTRESALSSSINGLSAPLTRPAVKLHLGDVTKKAVEIPKPKYPRMAKTARIAGKVKAEVVIDVDTGKVVWARVLNGHPLLRESILHAACEARFAPSPINSPPIRVSGFITYKFGNP